ncbi:uncharacterized protein LODBEIA_P51720 [Lodderomyces beijingensis]|uniref:Uncharacterized protein n=1 Tax=Lodderomyces beijingensis TaxID=1775926 RepID=A0ABP0ZS19_9ASCO
MPASARKYTAQSSYPALVKEASKTDLLEEESGVDHRAEVRRLRSRIQELEQIMRQKEYDWRDEVEDLRDRQLSEYRGWQKDLRQVEKSLEIEVAERQRQQRESDSKYAGLEDKLKSVEAESKAKDRMIAKMTKTHKDKIAELDKKLESQRLEIGAAFESKVSSEAKMQVLQSQVDNLQLRNEDLLSKNESLQRENENLKKQQMESDQSKRQESADVADSIVAKQGNTKSQHDDHFNTDHTPTTPIRRGKTVYKTGGGDDNPQLAPVGETLGGDTAFALSDPFIDRRFAPNLVLSPVTPKTPASSTNDFGHLWRHVGEGIDSNGSTALLVRDSRNLDVVTE